METLARKVETTANKSGNLGAVIQARQLAQAQKMPQVAMQYDMGKIFAWVAALGGLKNIQQFKIQVGDPAALAQQAAAGNMVPINDATKDLTRVPDSGRAQNMGATG